MKLQPVATLDAGGYVNQRYIIESADRGYTHEQFAHWPAAPDADTSVFAAEAIGGYFSPGRSIALWQHGEGLAIVTVEAGAVRVHAAAGTPAGAAACIDAVRELLPPHEAARDLVPVTFWTATPHGGRSIMREIDAAIWESIAVNYPAASGLEALMSPGFRPGVGGQLLLWHGEPGTGKTTALRALAREWRGWCDLHYIVDPEVFFGARADYMMEVLTTEVHYTSSPGDDERTRALRWRLLVLEDCGELLQPDAKREVGQALARLLNACDGLIGRGLRILVMLTTNESAEKLHEAVARPGRCAARIEFPSFKSAEARSWLAGHGCEVGRADVMTLADLYARLEGFRERSSGRRIGFAA